jgi:hypothetical protein
MTDRPRYPILYSSPQFSLDSRLYRPRPSILCDKTVPGASSGFFEENKACYVASSFERPTSYEATSTNERTPRCDATGSDERPTTHARTKTNERPTTYKVGKRKLAAFTKRQAEVVRAAQECSICIVKDRRGGRELRHYANVVLPSLDGTPSRASAATM